MRTWKTVSCTWLVTLAALAQGPDVIVGTLTGPGNFGTNGSGIYAYSLGTTSCNIGNVWLNWISGTNEHPVIAQNFYRLKNGRFEQIGMSWLKHGFYALSGSVCFNDCQGTDGTHLGIHCSDPYDSGLNGSQGNGPRSEVNASTGWFPYPIAGTYPAATATIGRRIQCAVADIDPAQNAGALYFGEGQYIAADDAAAGNDNNNASYRMIQFSGSFNASFVTGQPTVQQQPAIMGWQAADPSVVVTNVDFPNDGRFIVARKVTSLGGGNYHYEFAVHNLNSDRSGRGFTVDFPGGTTITNAGFKDISYHSGEPYSGTDWTSTINGSSINWATETYAQNQNANALRWGTLYNFWCDATSATESNRTIELFKPEPCPPDPVVPSASGYTLNTSAPYDDPALTAPVNGPSGDDSIALNVPIGFPFTFYGTSYSTVNVCTNGFLSFTSTTTQYTNTGIPNPADPNALIAGFWDDLVVGAGECQYQTLGTAPNRRFVVAWTNVNLYGTTQNQTFKIILDEGTNKITSTTVSTAGGGSSATRGVENQGGAAGTQGAFNQAGGAVAATSWSYTPYSAVLPSADLTVTGSTAPFGILTFSVNSNAPAGSPVEVIASFDPGPTDFGPYGILNIGFTPGLYFPVIDGGGAFGPPVPGHVTDACGDLSVPIQLTGAGVPPGLLINVQGGVIAPTSVPAPPNGLFHITDLEQIIT